MAEPVVIRCGLLLFVAMVILTNNPGASANKKISSKGFPPVEARQQPSGFRGTNVDRMEASPSRSLFRDITLQSGIDFRHVNGATPDKYMPETMGSGAVFFDFNNDGYVDIFLVNSGSLVDKQVSSEA